MKYFSAVVAASALVSISTSGFAAKFAPADTKFQLNGSLALQQSQGSTGFACPFTFTGKVTHAGVITIKGASFCANVQASGLPWSWRAVDNHPPHISIPMTFSINGFDCGQFLEDGYDFAGNFRMSFEFSTNGCLIASGTGTSTPTISVKK